MAKRHITGKMRQVESSLSPRLILANTSQNRIEKSAGKRKGRGGRRGGKTFRKALKGHFYITEMSFGSSFSTKASSHDASKSSVDMEVCECAQIVKLSGELFPFGVV